jgi:hypothetical protein
MEATPNASESLQTCVSARVHLLPCIYYYYHAQSLRVIADLFKHQYPSTFPVKKSLTMQSTFENECLLHCLHQVYVWSNHVTIQSSFFFFR